MVAPKVTPGFWKELLGYLGLCLFEALAAAVLIVVIIGVLMPLGGNSGASFCAVVALFVLGPAIWMVCVGYCLLAKIVVVLMPPSRRHWSLALYWGVTAGFMIWVALTSSRPVTSQPLPIRTTFLLYSVLAIPALILTFSHFVLLPRIKPGASARSVFALLRRRPTEPPAALPPQEPPA